MRQVTKNFNQPLFGTALLNNLFADDFFAKQAAKRSNACTPAHAQRSTPAVNIKEKETHYFIEVAAPGFEKSNFSIELEKGLLSISAKQSEQKEEEEKEYTHKEFSSRAFKRTFTLPEDTVNVEGIEASYEAGVLVVSIPKKEKEESKTKINIDVL